MKIAIPAEKGFVCEHFEKAEDFIIYTIEDPKPLTSEILPREGKNLRATAQLLKDKAVTLVICGEIEAEARRAVEGANMLLFSGIVGSTDEIVKAFLEGNLDYGTEENDMEVTGGCSGNCSSCHSCDGCTGHGVPYVETREFGDIVHLTKENFETEVLNDPGLIIIDFWADWCEPCKMFSPTFAELSKEEKKVKFCKVNVDEQPEIANSFGVDSIPMIAVLQDRQILSGMIGVHTKEEVKEMLKGCKK